MLWTYIGFGNIILKQYKLTLAEEKGELLTASGEVKRMSEEMFQTIFEGSDGNYAIQALILAAMKPKGW